MSTRKESLDPASTELLNKLLASIIVMHGTADLDQAKIVLLGNTHPDTSHNLYSQSIVQGRASLGDILLLEGIEKGKSVVQSKHYRTNLIQTPLIVQGWDDQELHGKALASLRGLIELSKRLDGKLSPSESLSLKLEYEVLESEFYLIGVLKRNAVMLQSLREIKRNHPRAHIFILAGWAHFEQQAIVNAMASESYIALRFKDKPEAQRYKEAKIFYLRNRT